MDDTARNPQTQPSTGQMQPGQPPTAQPAAGGMPQQQQPASQVQTPQSPSRHPEQGPTGGGLPPREAAPVDEAEAVPTASDDSAAQPDEAADAADAQQEAAPDIPVQESHPAVEVAPQLQEAGVEKGKDADRTQLPEEQLAKPEEQAQQPDTQAAASGISLATPVSQIKEVEKKNGIRNAIKWLAVALIRQLKRLKMKPEDQKTTW